MGTLSNAGILRPMTLTDVGRVYELEVLSFTTPWSYEALHEEVKSNPRARYFVFEAEVEGKKLIIGYCGMWIILDEGHITNLAIDPAHRGKGYAQQMLKAFIEEAGTLGVRDMTLEVRSGNTPAIHLYKKTGFVSAGLRKGYYLDSGEDAHIMWLKIKRGDRN